MTIVQTHYFVQIFEFDENGEGYWEPFTEEFLDLEYAREVLILYRNRNPDKHYSISKVTWEVLNF